jgi:DNA polymerase-1
MTIIEADYSQLELRIVALLAGDEELLEWYAQGIDVHLRNAAGLFSTDKPTKKQRDLAKRFVYGCNYGGEAGTIWASLAPKFPGLTLTDVTRMMTRWKMQRLPITRWQKGLLKNAYRNDYVEAPLSGRREYFHGQPEVTKILNYPIQATAADVIDAALPKVWHSLRQIQSWVLFQVHDSLVAETPHVEECKKRMARHMTKTVRLNGRACKFPIDFKVGKSWGG